jgi:hypothetical protein
MAMKKRFLNRCQNCGHAWFPQGFDFSRRCPNCESSDVDVTGRIYLAMLVLLAITAGTFWATDRPHKPAPALATPANTPNFMKPRHTGRATSPVPDVPLAAITTEAEGRREALRLYPDLGIAGSPLNTEFVTRYRSYQRLQPDFFQDPAWPLILVKESVVALGEQRKAQ